ncbi:stage II sporulation protein M, partial [Zobellia laminariae]
MAFAYGILLGIGTLFVMMQNGIMLGSFQYFFYDKGLLWESVRTIWIHGTIEIAVIIIAGCAGLVLANGILFPGTYTRLESFKRGVQNGLKIMLSTVPFFIIAGFLEGFVTRHTEMPDALAILIILASLALILFYYVIYPKRLNKRPTP